MRVRFDLQVIAAAMLLGVTMLTAQPTEWTARGVGAGGALFLPSISPHNSDEVYIACDMTEVFHSTDFGGSWNVLDFRQIQGGNRVGHVQFTETPSVRYALGTYNDVGRPLKSTDGGETWNPLPGDPTAGDAFALLADPNNASRVILTDYSTFYFSNDGGASFTQKYADNDACYIAGAFFDGNNIYVGTNAGILRSTDGGSSFAIATAGGIPSDEVMVSFTGAKQNGTVRFFCVTLNNGDVYPGVTGADYGGYKGVYSYDVGGSGWVSKSSGVGTSNYPFFVSMARNNTGTVYLAGGNDDSAPIVLKSTDAGVSWNSVLQTTGNANVATGWSGSGGDRGWSYGEYALGFTVAPLDANRAVITDLGFPHVTTDGGSTWRQAYVATADQNPANAATPQGRAYHSAGIENTTCWRVAWASSNTMISCFSDIRGVLSTDAGATWSFNYTGHTQNSMYYALKHPTTGTFYAATSTAHDMYQSTYLADERIDGADGGVLVSTDNGSNWATLRDFNHPVIWLAADPANPNRLYASVIHSTEGGIYVSNDIQNGAASTWTRLGVPARTEGHPFNIHVLTDGTLLCTYSGRRTASGFTASSGVFISTNGGTSWTDRSASQMQYWTKDVVIDPLDASQNTWYAGVFSGWGGPPNGLGGLYRTTDRGVSWTKVLDLERVTSCTINPNNRNQMYATTENEGLWYSSNAAATTPAFTQLASYPFRQPERVFYNPYKADEIWVTSFGNGMRVGTVGGPSGVEWQSASGLPPFAALVYPNPFTDVVSVDLTVERTSVISVKVINALGEEVAVLAEGEMNVGAHVVTWNAEGIPAGIYYLRIQGSGSTETTPVKLVR